MAKNITTTVTILGKDELSPVVSRAATRSVSELQSIQKRAAAISAGAFGVARASAGVGTAIAAPLVYAAKEAMGFEKSMVGLGKVANIELGTAEITKLGDEAKGAAYHLGRMPTEVAASMKALKQAGIPTKDLKDVAVFTGEAGVAFDMMADKAGDAFGSIKAAMGLTIGETKNTFDAINEISNKMKAEPEKLITFFTAGGAGVAGALKIPGQEIAAFGATLIQAGKSGEEAATLMERLAKNTMFKKPLRNIYTKAGEGTKGILSVLNAGAKMRGEEQDKFFQQFGDYGLEIRSLAQKINGPGGLVAALDLVSSREKYALGVHKEFTSVQKATLEQVKKEWVGFKIAVIDFGTAALPVIKDILVDVKSVVKDVGGWIKANPELAKTSFKAAAGIAAVSFAISGLSFVAGSVATAVGAVSTAIGWFSAGGALAGVTAGVTTFGGALWTAAAGATILGAPLWLAALAIGVIGYAAYKAYDKFEAFHEMVISLTTAIQSLADHAGPFMTKLFSGDFKGAWGELKAANAQTILNTSAHMAEWRRDHPSAKVETEAEYPDRVKAAQTLRAGNKAKSARVYTGVLGSLGIYSEGTDTPKPQPAQPKQAPHTPGGSNINLHSNPVFNISGPLTPDTKKELYKVSEDYMYNLKKTLQDVERDKLRTTF